METFLLVGLGNPGNKYTFTRHNVGWMALDYIAQKLDIKINKLKFKSLYGEKIENTKRLILLKPQTFMNNSGEAVFEVANYYNIPVSNIIILSDDVSLPSNKIRIRRSGSAGGQKGLENIIYLLNSDNIARVKIGVSDRSDPRIPLADWVLSNLSKEELKGLENKLEDILNAVILITDGKIEEAMGKYNGI